MTTPAQDASCGCYGWYWGQLSHIGLVAALMTFAVDQAHKWWMILGVGMTEGDRFSLLPFLDIVFVKNTGISYSLFDDGSMSWQFVLAAFACAASVVMWVWLSRPDTRWLAVLSLGLIIGGALGNALDRVLLGGVADFFQLHGFGRSWYVFNVADVAIVAGVIGLLYDSIVLSRKGAAKAP